MEEYSSEPKFRRREHISESQPTPSSREPAGKLATQLKCVMLMSW